MFAAKAPLISAAAATVNKSLRLDWHNAFAEILRYKL